MPYKDKKKHNESRRKSYYRNIETERKSSLEYYHKNKDEINERRKKNKTKIRKRQRKYEKNKWLTDVQYRIGKNIRRRIREVLKGNSKSEETIKLLGCSISELEKYLESKFIENMSWDNYGVNGWHIDHIKPCASFDLTDPEQQKECFHYSNLQPLWATDNIKKGSRT